MITVGKMGESKSGIYVGTGTPLANPYQAELFDHSVEARDKVCEEYEKWFALQVELKAPDVMTQLHGLQLASAQGDVILLCNCAPFRCHADTIKLWLERNPLTLPPQAV